MTLLATILSAFNGASQAAGTGPNADAGPAAGTGIATDNIPSRGAARDAAPADVSAETLPHELGAPSAALPALPAPPAAPSVCLAAGDGYFRAHLGGAIDRVIDWPNRGTRCQGEIKSQPPGVRLSFQRTSGGKPNLLFVLGLTGVREGQPAHEAGVNLTVIVQGTTRIYSTLGDSRCTVDSLVQKPLPSKHTYRVEARGFCTQPAHAVRGDGDVLVSTFEFAGLVDYGGDTPTTDAHTPDATARTRAGAAPAAQL